MKKYYFTFGQSHVHSVAGKTYDKDCVVEIKSMEREDARDVMFETFGEKWSHEYGEMPPDMSYFPRGIFPLN